ncbi:chemotaxis protein CheW [Marinimicrobium alkaliphilum]|uniref:chemotaxis protein CheW n=1 Tax=Marinimicrobium alkaliphilum TaxID=2202654 RepID=UPI000DB9ADBA|nr:chemotaxis protein CheW [Marinimicrobium alkaliphilum]
MTTTQQPVQQTQERAGEVPSLLVPMVHQPLLLPNVTVAEIVPPAAADPVPGAPEWYLGELLWREQRLPLLSFERLNGESLPESNPRGRIAVLNSTGVSPDLPFLAIVTQGIPSLARVHEDEIHERDVHCHPYERLQVSWAGEAAIIPDLAAMERACLEVRERLGY